ncbi:olfactory receptor 8K3-like [Equus przewalskii]|uniref:Olfactory receptor 8K3-like n=1 Tax=Equus przewalskii TaxID=9798 RepID=A0ABM4KI16_EQUPR
MHMCVMKISFRFSDKPGWKHTLTVLDKFILMGITDHPELQAPLFGLFFIICMISEVSNLGMVILTEMDSRLQTSVYFFLRHLAFTDLGYSTTVGPKMLVNFVVDKNTISYCFCAIKLAFFLIFIISEVFIQSSISYDCYVAICNPLLYPVIMSQRVCQVLAAISYLYSTFASLLLTLRIFNLSFVFFALLRHETEMPILILAGFNLIISLLIYSIVYIRLLLIILRINSAEGSHKAFSTCDSHLTVVRVFYGTLTFMYVHPNSTHSLDTDETGSVFYTVIIPMLNPLTYSLRSRELKDTPKKAINRN